MDTSRSDNGVMECTHGIDFIRHTIVIYWSSLIVVLALNSCVLAKNISRGENFKLSQSIIIFVVSTKFLLWRLGHPYFCINSEHREVVHFLIQCH